MDGSLGSATGRLNLDTSAFEAGIDRAASAANRLMGQQAVSNEQLAQGFQAIGLGVGAMGAGITKGFMSAVTAAADFEFGLNAVQAVANPDEWKTYGQAVEDTALTLGRDFPVSAQDAVAVIEELAKMGISLEHITGGAAEGVVMLANATGTDLVNAAEIGAVAMNQFGYSGEDMVRVADLLTNGANESATSVDGMGWALKYVGNTAAAMGMPLDEVITSFAIMSQRGIDNSRMGTGLRGILAGLGKTSGVAGKAIKELGLGMGGVNSVYDETTGLLKPMPEIIDQVRKATEGMSAAERKAALDRAFGLAGSNAMLAMLQNEEDALNGNGKGWDEYSAAINRSGSAEEAAKIRMQGLRGALELLSGSLDMLKVRAGQGLLAPFELLVRGLAKFVQVLSELPKPILTVITTLAGIAGAVMVVVGALMILAPFLLAAYNGFLAIQAAGGVAAVLSRIGGGLAALASQFGLAGRLSLSFGGIIRGVAGIVTGAIGLIVRAISRLLFANPLLTALALAIQAYASNWLGFRDIVDAAVSGIVSAISRIVGFIGQITGITGVINTVVDAVNRFRDAWNAIGSTTNNPFSRFLSSIVAMIGPLGTATNMLGKIQDILDDVSKGVEKFWDVWSRGGEDQEASVSTNFEVPDKPMAIEWVENLEAADGTGFDYMVRIVNDDGSFEEWGQIVESFDDEADPGIKHVRIKAEDGEYWTTYNEATGEWGESKIIVTADTTEAERDTRNFSEKLGESMQAMGQYLQESNFKPLRTLGTWLDEGGKNLRQFGAAWKQANQSTNPLRATLRALGVTFPRISDEMAGVERRLNTLSRSFRNLRDQGVNPVSAGLMALGNAIGGSFGRGLVEVGDRIQTFTSSFRNLRDQGVNPISATLMAFGNALGGPIGSAVTGFGQKIQDMVTLFGELRETGLSPVQAALSALGSTFPSLSGATEALSRVFDELGNVVTDLVDAFQSALDGDWSGVFDSLRSAAENAWDAIQAGIDLIGELAQGIGSITLSIAGWVIESAVDLWDYVSNWIMTEIGGGAAQEGGYPVGTVALTIAGWLVNAAQDLWSTVSDWIMDRIGGLSAGGGNAGGALPGASGGYSVGTVAVSIAGWVISQVKSLAGEIAERWPEWVASAKAAVKPITDIAVQIAGWVVTQTQSLAGKISELWPSWVASAKAAIQPITDIAVQIGGWVITQAQSLAGYIGEQWPSWVASAKAVMKDIGIVAVSIAGWAISVAGPPIAEAVKTFIATSWGFLVEIGKVVVSILALDPMYDGTAIDKLIEQEIIGPLVQVSADVLVNVLLKIGEMNSGELLMAIGIGIALLAGMVVAPLVLAVPVTVIAGVISALLLSFMVFQWIEDWARSNPVEAVEVLVSIAVALDEAASSVGDLIGAIRDFVLDYLIKEMTNGALNLGDVKVAFNFVFGGDEEQQEAKRQEHESGVPQDVMDAQDPVPQERTGNTTRDTQNAAENMIRVLRDLGGAWDGAATSQDKAQRSLDILNKQMEGGYLTAHEYSRMIEGADIQLDAMGRVVDDATASNDFFSSGLRRVASTIGAAVVPAIGTLGSTFGTVATAARTGMASATTAITGGTAAWGAAIGAAAPLVAGGANVAFGSVSSAASTGMALATSAVQLGTTGWGTTIGAQAGVLTGAATTAFSGVPMGATTAMATTGLAIGASAAGWAGVIAAQSGGLGAAATTAFSTVGTNATLSMQNVGVAIGGAALGWALAISMQGASLGAAATTAFGTVGTSVTTALAPVGPSINVIALGWAMGIAAQGPSMAAAGTAIGNAAGSAVPPAIASFTGSVASTTATYAVAVASNAGAMRAAGTAIGTAAGQGTQTAINGLRGSVQQAAASYVIAVAQNAGAMRSAGNVIGTAAANGAQQAVASGRGGVGNAAAGYAMAVAGHAGSMRAAGHAIGAAAGQGVVAGLLSMLGAVQAAANAIVATAMAAMAAAAAIGSPSKITTQYGVWIGEGLERGMLRMLPAISRVAEEMSSAATMMSKAMPDLGGLRGVYNRGAQMLNRMVGEAGGAIIQGWERLTDGFWRNAKGEIRKGILAEDGGYVNPNFYDRGHGGLTGMTMDQYLQKQATLNESLQRSMQRMLATTVPYVPGYLGGVPGAGATTATTVIDNRKIVFEDGAIVQQPGESGESLGRRLTADIMAAWDNAGGVKL